MLMPSIFRENLIDNFFNDFSTPSFKLSTPVNGVMKTDILENETGFDLNIDLPGYKKDDVTAELKDGYMTVTAKTSSESEEKNEAGKYLRRERYYCSCQRSFYVGDTVTEEDIKAKFEDGILKIHVPKKEPVPEVEENKYICIE